MVCADQHGGRMISLSRIKTLTQTMVCRVLLTPDGNQAVATGVELLDGRCLTTTKEAILSCSAIRKHLSCLYFRELALPLDFSGLVFRCSLSLRRSAGIFLITVPLCSPGNYETGNKGWPLDRRWIAAV